MSMPLRTPWYERLGVIDRRWIYLVLFLATLTPLVIGKGLPLYVTSDSESLFQHIQKLEPGKIVVLSCNWDAGTQAENRPQTLALMRHLLRRKIPFAIVSIGSPTSPQLAQDAAEEAARKEGRGEYGVDYCNWGYKVNSSPWLQALPRDVPKMISSDWKGKPLVELPVMRGVRTFKGSVSLLIDITASATLRGWVSLVQPQSGVPIGFACTAVMAPEAYPYLDSKQVVGMLTGIRGGAEYEQLIGAPADGFAVMTGQSFAHLCILLFIVLGNFPILMRYLRRGRA